MVVGPVRETHLLFHHYLAIVQLLTLRVSHALAGQICTTDWTRFCGLGLFQCSSLMANRLTGAAAGNSHAEYQASYSWRYVTQAAFACMTFGEGSKIVPALDLPSRKAVIYTRPGPIVCATCAIPDY